MLEFGARRPDKLKRRVRKGIPPEFRGLVWQLLSGAEAAWQLVSGVEAVRQLVSGAAAVWRLCGSWC